MLRQIVWNTGRLAHADAYSLSAAKHALLSNSDLSAARDDGFLWPDVSEIFSKHVSLFFPLGAATTVTPA